MSGGFFRGTSSEQDTRFSNKMAKLLKTQKFPPELDQLVDMSKVKMDVIRPWIASRVTELLGIEDEVLINFIFGLLDGKFVDGKQIQIQLTGFMEKNTGKFMKELWSLLTSAQNNISGIPQQFLDAKAEETRKKKAEDQRILFEVSRKKEEDQKQAEQEREKKLNSVGDLAITAKDAAVKPTSSRSPRQDLEEKSEGVGSYAVRTTGKNGRIVTRSSRSRSGSPMSSQSRSRSPRFSRRQRSRSFSRSPRRRRHSRSPMRRGRSPISVRSPRRRHLPAYSRSPPRRRKSPIPRSLMWSRRRSPSFVTSPSRRRVTSYPSAHERRLVPSQSPRENRLASSPSPSRRRAGLSSSPHRRRAVPSSSPIRHRISPSPSLPRRRLPPSPSPPQRRPALSPSPPHRRLAPSPSPPRRRTAPSPSPLRRRPAPSSSPPRRRPAPSPSPPHRRPVPSPSPARRRPVASPSSRRRPAPSPSPPSRRIVPSVSSPLRGRLPSPSPLRHQPSPSPPPRRRPLPSPSPPRRGPASSPLPMRRRVEPSPSPPRRRPAPSPSPIQHRPLRSPSPPRRRPIPSPSPWQRHVSSPSPLQHPNLSRSTSGSPIPSPSLQRHPALSPPPRRARSSSSDSSARIGRRAAPEVSLDGAAIGNFLEGQTFEKADQKMHEHTVKEHESHVVGSLPSAAIPSTHSCLPRDSVSPHRGIRKAAYEGISSGRNPHQIHRSSIQDQLARHADIGSRRKHDMVVHHNEPVNHEADRHRKNDIYGPHPSELQGQGHSKGIMEPLPIKESHTNRSTAGQPAGERHNEYKKHMQSGSLKRRRSSSRESSLSAEKRQRVLKRSDVADTGAPIADGVPGPGPQKEKPLPSILKYDVDGENDETIQYKSGEDQKEDTEIRDLVIAREEEDVSVSPRNSDEKRKARKRKKEEKRLRKEERRRRREEKHRRKDERRAAKAAAKAVASVTPPPDLDRDGSILSRSDDDSGGEKQNIEEDGMESEQKRLENELRKKALDSLRAKKAINS